MFWIIAAILAAMGIGSVGIWVKLVGTSVPIFTLGFLRVGIAAACLFLYCLVFDRKVFSVTKKELSDYAVIGLLTGSAMTLFLVALTYLSISQAYVLDAFFPFFTVLLMGHILKNRLQVSDLVSIILGAVAIFIFNLPMGFDSSAGVAIMLVEIILYALMIVYMRKARKTQSLKNTFWFMLFASIWLLPMPFIFGFGQISAVVPWVLSLGVVTALAYACLVYAVSRMWAEEMSIALTAVTTSFAILMSWLLFKEVLTAKFLLGAGIVLFSGVLLNLARVRRIPFLSKKLPELASTHGKE